MNVHDLNPVLQITCITLLGVVCILLKYARAGLNTWTGIGLTTCVICYLILETPFVQTYRILFFIALTGSILVPVLFFLLTKAIFDDHFKPTWTILGWFALEIVPHFYIYLRGVVSISDTLLQITYIVSEIVSLGFVLAGLFCICGRYFFKKEPGFKQNCRQTLDTPCVPDILGDRTKSLETLVHSIFIPQE